MKRTMLVLFLLCEVLLLAALIMATIDYDYIGVGVFGVAMLGLLILFDTMAGNQRRYVPLGCSCEKCKQYRKHHHIKQPYTYGGSRT
jgi:hypothetical protein